MYLAIFATTSDETLVYATKTRIDCVVSLSNALKTSNQTFVLQVPKVKALRRYIQQGEAVS